MNHDLHDTDFEDVNGQRFDRLRVAGAYVLIEALRALRDPEWAPQREIIRAVVRNLDLTPPERDFSANAIFPRTLDILKDAEDITWGDVMVAIAQAEKTDARLEQMGL